MTDTGWHSGLFPATAQVWNRFMTTVMDSRTVVVGAAPLRPEDVVAVARHDAPVELDAAALARVAASRTLVEGLADDPEPHYGISTGFGALATTFIAAERRAQLQASLIRSHAAGTGAEV
jgi:histidine ammonia-lyase